jgi:hypothetical protein
MDVPAHPRCPSADFESPSPSFFFPDIPLFSVIPQIRHIWFVRFDDGRLGSVGHEIGHAQDLRFESFLLWAACIMLAKYYLADTSPKRITWSLQHSPL